MANSKYIYQKFATGKFLHYQLEKSTDGRSFTNITTINSKGNSVNDYTETDVQTLNNTAYFRIKQVGVDERFSYSSIIK